jgi:hypothetical protein
LRRIERRVWAETELAITLTSSRSPVFLFLFLYLERPTFLAGRWRGQGGGLNSGGCV